MGRDGNVSARTGAPSGTRTAAQTKRRIANLKQVIRRSPQSEASVLCRTASVKTLYRRTLGPDPCASNQLSKPGRRDRHLRYADAEWRQRVLDRRYDRGGGRNDADFADAFYPQRIMRRRRFLVERLQFWHIGRRR